MRSTLALILVGLATFLVVAVLLIQLMPEPLGDTDYLLAGSVATLVALLSVFLTLISTRLKTKDIFFKRRKKQR